MTGAQHYKEAERLLELANVGDGWSIDVNAGRLLAAAQVHATLAQAAATIDAGTVVVPAAHQAWNSVLGEGADR